MTAHQKSQYLAFFGIVIMFLLYATTNDGFFGPERVGDASATSNPLIVPPGFAFAIWGPIYLGLLIFPIYQLVKNRDNHPAWIPLRRWFFANTIANGVWLVFSTYQWQILMVATIFFMLLSLYRINLLLVEIERDGAAYNFWTEWLVLAVYFAWITLASVLNVTSALAFYEWDGFGLAEKSWALVMIPVAALIAGLTARRFRSAAYAGVVVWAFGTLAVRHFGEIAVLAYVALAVAVFFVFLGISFLRKRHHAQGLASS
ncbi:MAG: hypothetical protein AAFZ52_02955 [Bacteroidota bacterium]